MIIEIILVALTLLFFAIMRDRKPKTMPPGPAEIPFIGNKPVEELEHLENLRKEYGDLITTRMGNSRIVTISDYKMAKQAMASLECADRPEMFRMFQIDPEDQGGIISANGIPWVHDRRFVLRHLRDLGMGKTHLEVAIHDEARALVEHIKSLNGKPSNYPVGLRTSVLNVVWQLVASKRYDLTSEEVFAIFGVIEEFREKGSFLMFAEYVFPFLRTFPDFIKNALFKVDIMHNFRKEMFTIIDKTVKEHEKTLDDTNPRDLIDDYLIEMKKNEADPESLANYSALHQIVSDLFGAGSDTVTNMLRWTIFFIVKHPEITKKCQEEIDRVVAADQMVSILDKPQLPYIEAFTTEVLRHVSLAFMNVQRATSKDYKIGGYVLPKGTQIAVNSYHIHHDPHFWDDPYTFKPERFLDADGKFQAKLGRIFAFGAGRRQCLGESLARMEYFLFASAILQNFTIEKPAGMKLDESVNHSLGLRIIEDQPYIYKSRKA